MNLHELFRFQAGWLLSNWWWLLPSFLAVLMIVLYLANVLKKASEHKPEIDMAKLDRIIAKLGGLENILETSGDGNRLKFTVKELKKCDLVAIKEDGVQGIFVAGKQVKFQLPEMSEALLNRIEEGKKEATK
ncbi:MAG TPA: hypothetical protein PLH02_04375 [Bacillota bacterium]|nr:hypothetical protein [Bacillota bacterium]HPF42652.1 hypothetical protein [Bacillota bacterium]HPJ85525.1 hypothetical protein [Bacillota bacterium]HPQ62085.1 hypothetical protein [Bacillota bacterium]HRX92459.1 hypothetical protein [Candidatus Izemoplasmatales bacterium]